MDFFGKEDFSLDDILEMKEEDIKEFTRVYEAHKEEKRNIQRDALSKLPLNPPLVCDCVHYLRINGGLDSEGIFRVNGDSNVVDKMRSTYVNETTVEDVLKSIQESMALKVFDIATALKQYFRKLDDPLLPHVSYDNLKESIESNSNVLQKVNKELSDMVEPNKSIFSFVMMLFQDIVDNSAVNKMGASNLSTCLTMSIIRFKDTGSGNHMAAMMEVGMSTKLLVFLLTNVDFTNFISPKRYLELLTNTKYRNYLLPKDMDEFMEHEQFARYKKKYAAALGPPPVVPTRRTNKPVINDDDVDV